MESLLKVNCMRDSMAADFSIRFPMLFSILDEETLRWPALAKRRDPAFRENKTICLIYFSLFNRFFLFSLYLLLSQWDLLCEPWDEKNRVEARQIDRTFRLKFFSILLKNDEIWWVLLKRTPFFGIARSRAKKKPFKARSSRTRWTLAIGGSINGCLRYWTDDWNFTWLASNNEIMIMKRANN